MRTRAFAFCAVTVALGLLLAAWAVVRGPFTTTAQAAAPNADQPKTIPDALANAGKFKSLLAAIKAAGLENTLTGNDRYVFFAPTDDAFAAVPAATLDALMQDPAKLKTVLQNHLVARQAKTTMSLDRLAKAGKLKTVGGAELTIVADPDGAAKTYTVSGAKIAPALNASNGVIYPIDKLLLPMEKPPAEKTVP